MAPTGATAPDVLQPALCGAVVPDPGQGLDPWADVLAWPQPIPVPMALPGHLGQCLTLAPPTRPDPDPYLQADRPAQPWPVPIPGKVADAQGWGCPQLPLCLPCSPAGVGGTGLAGEALPRHPWGGPEAPSSQPQEAAGPCCAVVCGEDINYHSSHENNRSRVQSV